jgi:myo-inositol-1(or 4)-monophosphatase
MTDFNVLAEAVKVVDSKVCRDFNELENLQNSNKTINFVNATLKYMREKMYDFFTEKRLNYSLVIRDYDSRIVENSEYLIFVNCISGLRNFEHGIPYFSTTISVKKGGRTIIGIINSYAEQKLFYTIEGSGSFYNNKKLRVSNRSVFANTLTAIKCGNDRDVFNNITKKLPVFRVNNCSTLDFCYTGYGKYDCNIVLDGIREELELGELFIKEAGGLTKYLNNSKTSCFYTNSLIFNDVKNLFNEEINKQQNS